jgi:uncharacterized secreted protein with C-terminal beta-propeller domain
MKSRRRFGSTRLRSVERLETRAMMSADGLGFTPVVEDAVQTPSPAAATFASLEELRQWVTQQATTRYGELFETTFEQSNYGWCYCDFGVVLRVVATDTLVFNGVAAPIAFNYQTNVADQTNVQVEGVDEADLVETDGEFLYMVAGTELVIIDIRDPENLTVASRVELGETPTGIYLTGDRLTLVSAKSAHHPTFIPVLWNGGGYWPNSDQSKVTVTVLDISDREAPTQVEKTEIDGSLVSSRMVDGELRLVTQQTNYGYLPAPRYTALPTEGETGAVQPTPVEGVFTLALWNPVPVTYQYESLEEYVDRVVAEWAPMVRTLSVDGEVISETPLIDPTLIEKPADPCDYNISSSRQNVRTTIATFNVLDDAAGPSDTETIRTHGATTIYADGDNLYVFENLPTINSNGVWITRVFLPPTTQVTKFSFGAGGAIHQDAKGTFSGALLNQFAVDEHEGYLRVVTTNNFSQAGQTLSVLQQQGDKLVVVGSVSGLAPNETLHSVRFNGDTAYLVTFRNVDPLFVVDLSDPEAPVVTGELKIPGYSEYLQPIGENHLLGIGRGANEQNGRFEELQISIFDVTDGGDPLLAHRYSVEGGRNTTTIATGNRWTAGDGDHHAVAFYEDTGILTLPIQNEGDWNTIWLGGLQPAPTLGSNVGGLLVLSVDVESGIEKLALIQHSTPILRSIRVGDTLIAISATQVSSHQLTSPAEAIDELDLPTGEAGLTTLTEFIAEQEAPQHAAREPYLPVVRESFVPATPETESKIVIKGEAPRIDIAREPYVPAVREEGLTTISVAEAIRLPEVDSLAGEPLVHEPFVPAVRTPQVLNRSVTETPQLLAREIYIPDMQAPEQSSRSVVQHRPLLLSAAASDEALLLLTSDSVSDADESPQDPAVCFEAAADETPQPNERGVRQTWRPAVKA